jgi:hypothetical protein
MKAELDLLNLIISRNQKYPKTKKEIRLQKFYMKHVAKKKPTALYNGFPGPEHKTRDNVK